MPSFRVHPLAALGITFVTVMCSAATDRGSNASAGRDGSPDEQVDTGPSVCPAGLLAACDCQNGQRGVKRCSTSGSWGACENCAVEECSGSDVSRCEPPASECRDQNNLRYFTNPTCRGGRCVWEEQLIGCYACTNGGCSPPSTAGGGPSFDASSADASRTDSGMRPECTTDDVSRCTAPPSQCLTSSLLRYYVNPTCAAGGRCVWDTQQYSCSYCMNGGCLGTTTSGGGGP